VCSVLLQLRTGSCRLLEAKLLARAKAWMGPFTGRQDDVDGVTDESESEAHDLGGVWFAPAKI
jgi:hypothetical protein